ncbi:hypothetical protein CTI12_AA026710 [Artemisia annua]|uniref:Uncharacterized protein n=1 Tax=Artemisia annua TaxID=35608 RepID=A0A2U1QIB6_ARTAN|nr:hypothetical protein CTI12_AA026710 [Artemisia annua]
MRHPIRRRRNLATIPPVLAEGNFAGNSARPIAIGGRNRASALSRAMAEKSFVERKKSDALVILIYGSLCEDVLCTAFGIHKTNDVWEKLDANYKYSTDDQLQAGQMEPIHKLNVVSGAALQMQRELQWFKGVEVFEVMVFTREHKDLRNKDLVFTREHKDLCNMYLVFTREHKDLRNKDLRNEGEEWMKTTDMLWLLVLDFFGMLMKKTRKKFREETSGKLGGDGNRLAGEGGTRPEMIPMISNKTITAAAISTSKGGTDLGAKIVMRLV